MKVCFFSNEYPPNVYGGAGVHVDYLSRELSQLVPLTVKYFGSHVLDRDGLQVMGVEVEDNLLKGFPKELTSVFSAFYKNMDFLKPPFEEDIVHCHTWYTHFAGILAKLAYGKPLVITTHSLEPLRPWKREQLGRGYNVSSWVEEQALALADAIIAVSSSTKQDVLENFNVDEKKIHVIPNGIDTNEFRPDLGNSIYERFGVDPSKPYLLFVGRITRQKGIIHLVESIPHIDPDLQIVLCAGAPDTDEISDEMEGLVSKIQENRKNLIWIREMVDKETLAEFYAQAYLFCCPSVYEPFGIINLEAMACETPVVASKVGGIPEVVEENETGLLIPLDFKDASSCSLRDPIQFSKDLAMGVNQLFRDQKLRDSMAKKSRKRAVEKFSWQSIARQVKTVYDTLI